MLNKALSGILIFLCLVLVISMFPGVIGSINKDNIDSTAAYWESQGYTAYADPMGNWNVGGSANITGNLDVGGVISGDGSGLTGVPDNDANFVPYTGASSNLNLNGNNVTASSGNFTYLYQNGYQVTTASGTPDYVVGVNTTTDDVAGSTGYWVKSGATGQVVETASTADVAIQYALNLTGHIKLTNGAYSAVANISIPANTTLSGTDKVNTVVTFSGASVTQCFVLAGNNAHIETLHIVMGAGVGAVGSLPNGVYAATVDYVSANNLTIYGDLTASSSGSTHQCGIYFDTVRWSSIKDNDIFNVKSHGVYLGMEIGESTTYSLYNIISGNHIHNAAFESIALGGYSNLVESNTSDISGTGGYLIYKGASNTLVGNTSYNDIIGVWCMNDVNNNTITGNIFLSGTTGIKMGGTTANQTTGGTATNNSFIGNTFNYYNYKLANMSSGVQVFRDNIGFNPWGLVTNPIGTATIGLGGSSATVTSTTVYTVSGVDCFITSTGGTVSNIVIKDASANVMLTGVTTLTNQFVPVGYSVTWTHTGAPTVTVFGN